MTQKKTILDLYKMKENGGKAAWTTAYDCCFAAYAEKAGMDMILVGDSMGMVVYGYQGTIPVTMDMCINACQAVRRGAPNTYVIGDMPFGSYHESVTSAVHNAVRFIKEGDVDAVKLEGGVAVTEVIKAIVRAGIVVFGHVGLTPQSSTAMGGFRAQGRTVESARAVIQDAIAVYEAGSRCILLEGIPEAVGAFIHRILPIPVYGIGAGSDTDGQVLVVGDSLGMFEAFKPKFAKKYADIAGVATQGFAQFIKEVKEGSFPASEHKYSISGDIVEFEKLFIEMESNLRK
ncbi:3-methyl-2-oxobutanoate hydroxymethyltransferase [Sporomusa rhizae]|uniref:3-methyl-2-oxobutanoate hydroxymethyltransferase n=1 Tax=Sporomusa rhizae TaxID=357999 RepID=UPI00352B1A7C